MFKLNLKKAFTLSEIMVVLFIMSIIIGITLVVQKPFDRGVASLYQRAYRALSLAVYNVKLDLKYGSPFPIGDPSDLCELLANSSDGYLNAASNMVACNDNTVPLRADSTKGDFPDSAIQFTTTNGMRFYIATDKAPLKLGYLKTFTLATTPLAQTFNFKYCVIFIDLNGDKPPNTATWTPKGVVDIVAFIVTESGDVLPIGYPQVDIRYLTARVHYPDGTLATEIDRYSKPMSYYYAKWDAWGNGENPDELQSLEFVNGNPDFTAALPDSLPSKLIVDYTLFPDHPAVHTATYACLTNGVDVDGHEVFSPCEVEIGQYY